MKKILIFVTSIVVLALTASVNAQTWTSLQKAPGSISKFTVQTVKERVTAADSTTYQRIVGSDTTIAIKMGKIPARSMITAVWVYVKTAFAQSHGSKADSITIGSYADVDCYMQHLAVSSTGVKSGTLTSTRYVAADSLIYLYFLKRGTILSNAGDVVAALEYVEFPR